jgi:hypothetical protein
MHDPRELHMTAFKCIMHYLQGTLDLGLHLYRSSTSELVVYSDVDWAGFPDTRWSTSGYVVFLGDNLVSWSSECQNTVSCSNSEEEYSVVANGIVEACWLHQILMELYSPLSRRTLIYCNNVSVIYLVSNIVQHQRTKHVEIDLHFVRDKVAIGEVHILHVLMTSQFIDIFTKGLPSPLFSELRSSLNLYRD